MGSVENWSEDRLKDLLARLRLRGGADATVEVVSAGEGKVPNLPRTLCAFANTAGGGTVIVGVDQREDFAVRGVLDPRTVEAGVLAQARAAVEPPVEVTTHTLDVEGKAVVVADVRGLPPVNGPAVTGSVAYVRCPGGERAMSGSELRMMGLARRPAQEWLGYDARPVPGTSVNDLDGSLVAAFLDRVRSENSRLSGVHEDGRLLRLLRVTTAGGELTTAGHYALGFYPQGVEPGLSVTLTAEGSGDGERSRIEGPLPVLLQESVTWVLRRLRGRNLTGEGQPLAGAIRALIADALVQRHLGPEMSGTGEDVHIRLGETALSISSPGGRWRGGRDPGMNPRLLSISRYLRTEDGSPVLSGEGPGFGELVGIVRNSGLPAPELVDVGVSVTLTVWLQSGEMHQAPTQNESTEARASFDLELATIGRNAPLIAHAVAASVDAGATLAELSEATSLSNGQVRYALKSLMGAGMVQMDGRQGDRSTVYRWLG